MNIYQSINEVMKEVGAVGKNNRNEKQSYQYRGIDDVMTALAPAMQKHGVFVTPEVLEQIREEKDGRNGKLLYSIVKVKYTFRALDGSSVEAVVMGEGMDSGDKATNKAMSAAFKYALLQTFCIPTDELVDSEKDSPEVVKRSNPNDTIRPEEADYILKAAQDANLNIGWILEHYKIKDFKELTRKQMMEIGNTIKKKNEDKRNEGQSNSSDSNGTT